MHNQSTIDRWKKHWTQIWEETYEEPKWLSERSINNIKNFDYPSNSTKTIEVTLLYVDFSKAFIYIHRRKIEQILLTDGLPKENVAAIMMLYKNTIVKVRSPDEETEYFKITAGVPQGDTLAPYFFLINVDYELRTSIDNERQRFQTGERRSGK